MLNLSHKKLAAWQKSIELLPLLYNLCKKLPKEETFNFVSQIKRAGLSISNNIAEGSARKSKAEKNRFFEISRSSIVEIDNCLTALIVLKYIELKDLDEINALVLKKLITGLINVNS